MIHKLLNLKSYRPGDWVVFRKPKRSTSPGPRAQHVAPARHGEEYFYEVEKYWVVEDVQPEHLVLRTRRGKRHQIPVTDQRLRRARWWERLMLKNRFPVDTSTDPANRSD
jgi:hypothetical protein